MYFPALTLSVQLSRSDVWIIQTALCLSAVAIKHTNKQQQNLQSENHEQKLAVGVEVIILLKKKIRFNKPICVQLNFLQFDFSFYLLGCVRSLQLAAG